MAALAYFSYESFEIERFTADFGHYLYILSPLEAHI